MTDPATDARDVASSALLCYRKRRADEAWRAYYAAYTTNTPVEEIRDAYNRWREAEREHEAACSQTAALSDGANVEKP